MTNHDHGAPSAADPGALSAADIDTLRDRMARDLLALGVRPGGELLMHASLSSLGYVPGGAETVIQALLQALGSEGTLLLPGLSYEIVEPLFDVRHTPVCVGAIPEHFRTREGTIRSLHPTHSVCAAGPRADELTRDHWQDASPVGAHSPFRRMRDVGGQLLFLGCGTRPNTSMHGVEELVEPPYLFGPPVTYTLIDGEGVAREKEYVTHGFSIGGWGQRYDRLEHLLARGTEHRVGGVLAATAHLYACQPMWEIAERTMRANPFYFVEKRQ